MGPSFYLAIPAKNLPIQYKISFLFNLLFLIVLDEKNS